MQSQLQAAINQICAEKNLDREIIIEAIENAIAIAYKKDFGSPNQKIKVTLGDDISEMRIFEEREVVEKIKDFELEITLKEAKKIRPDAKIDDKVFVNIPMHEKFGRIAAQTARHVINQKINEAEREMLFEKFKNREGELLTAQVQKIDRDCALVEIEKTVTMLPNREQIFGEKYFTGQRIKVLLEKVELTSKGPQLKITRASNDFIVALFEAEIPEMRDELVYVARIARESGVRCKIAVASDDQSIDPVGAFVGQRGSRINVVMEEVGDERLDIIQFYEDPKKLLLAALSPAKVAKVEFFKGNRGENRVKIFVREEERAMAIGKKGQNVRLAGNLINMQIDVITYDGPPEELEKAPTPAKTEKKEISTDVEITELKNIDPEIIEKLTNFGLNKIKMLEGMTPNDLMEIDIEPEKAQKIVDAVKKFSKNN